MNKKEICRRFFDGKKKLAKKVNLTEEEAESLDKLEWVVLCDNGLRQINGSWSLITIIEAEDDEEERLLCHVSCGVQDQGDGGRNYEWKAYFNREDKDLEEYYRDTHNLSETGEY
jgi:hypothetical protein